MIIIKKQMKKIDKLKQKKNKVEYIEGKIEIIEKPVYIEKIIEVPKEIIIEKPPI